MKDVHVEASLAHLAVGRGRISVSYRKRNARKPLKDWYPELIFVCYSCSDQCSGNTLEV